MSYYCRHSQIVGRCTEGCSMGYFPPPPPFRPNLDRFGMPKDYETYLWATYGPGRDVSPGRRAFLHGIVPKRANPTEFTTKYFGFDLQYDEW